MAPNLTEDDRLAAHETSFGARLAAARTAAGLTQEQLGEAVGGVAKQAVSKWEKDQNQPGPAQLKLICERLQVSSDHLVGVELQARAA